ncbi:permease prefix domain 1-containing protein [Bacillus sp. UNC438CL73TsuS30]|uniref:permease prefix domain 1-containing protein n=1 Tax=Bacillus sp. UNC438CL73TsuS30 TaxID=1340434 RepID=UPI00047CBBC4|nr:permease prefix domain 1-containing protein [Bacillus sp. UNC438CL73TsuS30]
MKKIEAFVDSVYHGVGGNQKEIKELKAEMKSHLLEAVHELKLEGMAEQEAIDIAIERFGGEKEIRSIVAQLFQAQKTFAKWVLFCSIVFLLLSLSIFGFVWQYEEQHSHELSVIATQIADELKGKDEVSQEMKKEIARLVESTDFISQVSIYNSKNIRSEGRDWVQFNTELMKPDYKYQRIVWTPEWLAADLFPYGNGDEQWYVEMQHRSFDSLAGYVLLGGVAIYWTLFTIWATINAYHHRRLNIGWIIAFALFNVIGYLAYFLLGNRVQSKTIS